MSHSVPAVAYPAGKCPVKLKGTSYDEVVEWAENIFCAGRSRDLIYLPSAIAFFAQQFYNFTSPEYKEICSHLISRYGSLNYYQDEINKYVEARRFSNFNTQTSEQKLEEKPKRKYTKRKNREEPIRPIEKIEVKTQELKTTEVKTEAKKIKIKRK